MVSRGGKRGRKREEKKKKRERGIISARGSETAVRNANCRMPGSIRATTVTLCGGDVMLTSGRHSNRGFRRQIAFLPEKK